VWLDLISGVTVPIIPKANDVLLLVPAIYLVVTAIDAVFLSGRAYGFTPDTLLSMAFMALVVVGIILMLSRRSAMMPDPPHHISVKVGWLGVAAGVLLVAIRFTSTDAWWTGHLMN
jgi:hypothetical protein